VTVIFDENVPWPLCQSLAHHSVTSVQREGFSGAKNGELLARIDGRFDVFVIADKNMRYQQNLSGRIIAIVELPTNRWPILQAITQKIVAAVDSAQPGSYVVVEQ
jgi:hypothetical protein